MDAIRLDEIARLLTALPSRRMLLRGLVGVVLGHAAPPLVDSTVAKDRRGKKRKKKQPTFNAFGCLDVGQKCGGRSDLCCSGICAGKKPKKGESDKRTCAAHNTGGCVPAQDTCAVGQTVHCATFGFCTRTTGEAGFCATSGTGQCTICTKDADCFLSGPGAACIVCPSLCPMTTTACIAPAAD